MIDVDRLNVDQAITFFQDWFNRDKPTSQNEILYLFLPLFKKSYTDEEWLRIIADHDLHAENNSVVAIKGLNLPDTIVTLTNGVHTAIRKLLLSIPSPGLATGKLFIQVEHQSNQDWLLCCFQTLDSTKVTLRLSTLEDSLKKYIKPESHQHLFKYDHNITFSRHIATVTKGRQKLPRLKRPDHIREYTDVSLKKLIGPTPKWLAVDLTEDSSTTASPRVVTPNQHHPILLWTQTSESPSVSTSQVSQSSFQQLQTVTQQHHTTLQTLEKCCINLADTTKKQSQQMEIMNADFHQINKVFNQKFDLVTKAIDTHTNSPSRHRQKHHKDHHGHPDLNLHWNQLHT